MFTVIFSPERAMYMRKGIDITKYVLIELESTQTGLSIGQDLCINAFPAAAACTVPISIVQFIVQVVIEITEIVKNVFEFNYNEDVDSNDSTYLLSVSDATYENTIVNHENIITLIRLGKRILTSQDANFDDLQRQINNDNRLLVETCQNDSNCKLGMCSCPDQDPRYKCDCKPDFQYISSQYSAGCDNYDSDGDGDVDVCEDRFPPSILIKNLALFRCDETDVDKLCYSDKVFSQHVYAENFLRHEFIPVDDCMMEDNLGMDVVHVSGTTCNEVVYGKIFCIIIFYPKCKLLFSQ